MALLIISDHPELRSTEKPGERTCFIKQNIPPFMSQLGLVLFSTDGIGIKDLIAVKNWHRGGTSCLSLADPPAWGRRPKSLLEEMMEVLTGRASGRSGSWSQRLGFWRKTPDKE